MSGETSYRAGRDEWMDSALCWWVSASDFHAEGKGGSTHAAKTTCGLCPVRAQCLAYAMRTESSAYREGVYGGTGPVERHRLARAGWVAGDPLPPIRLGGPEKRVA